MPAKALWTLHPAPRARAGRYVAGCTAPVLYKLSNTTNGSIRLLHVHLVVLYLSRVVYSNPQRAEQHCFAPLQQRYRVFPSCPLPQYTCTIMLLSACPQQVARCSCSKSVAPHAIETFSVIVAHCPMLVRVCCSGSYPSILRPIICSMYFQCLLQNSPERAVVHRCGPPQQPHHIVLPVSRSVPVYSSGWYTVHSNIPYMYLSRRRGGLLYLHRSSNM